MRVFVTGASGWIGSLSYPRTGATSEPAGHLGRGLAAGFSGKKIDLLRGSGYDGNIRSTRWSDVLVGGEPAL